MENIITATEFATFRNISQKVDTAKIDEAISLAQQSDLVDILGDFYFDVMKNKDEANYADLMNGSEFTYNDEKFEHAGIKKLLADYTHARYVYLKPINDTAFGFMVKETQDGSPVDRNTLKDLSKQDQVDAGIKFKFIEKYILSEPELFSRYCKNKPQGTSFNSIRLTKL